MAKTSKLTASLFWLASHETQISAFLQKEIGDTVSVADYPANSQIASKLSCQIQMATTERGKIDKQRLSNCRFDLLL